MQLVTQICVPPVGVHDVVPLTQLHLSVVPFTHSNVVRFLIEHNYAREQVETFATSRASYYLRVI